jgi:hypothetical protein
MDTLHQAREGRDTPSAEAPSGADGGTRAAPPTSAGVRTRRLAHRDRELLALLGLCRYLTARQVVALEPGPASEKAAAQRLRRLAREVASKGWPPRPPLLRAVPYRAADGEPLHLWTLSPAGCALAAGELARVLRAFRGDVGAAFAEHFIFLTDLFVQLARPHLRAGVAPRELPFRWNVTEDVDLPWRDRDASGDEKARVIRPDAVLEVPSSQRRFFIECEMGTHTLVPLGPDKPQATVRKLERYDAYVSGLADVPTRLSHYRKKYPDGWPCEVLFLVRSEGRRRSTEEALRACLETLAGTQLRARAVTLEEAVAHCSLALPSAGTAQAARPATGLPDEVPPAFYGEHEHGAVKDFVLDMTAALAEANALLRRHGLGPIPGPASKAPMLDFLRKAQAEMQRRRARDGHSIRP